MPVPSAFKTCCSIAPVFSDYTPKGTYESLGDFTTVYVTKPAGQRRTDKALIAIYDIFGFFPQTQQGADILAESLQATVYMPDFFEPDGGFPIDKVPPATPEDQDALAEFLATTANYEANTVEVKNFAKFLRSKGYKDLGLYGFCWGGRVTMLASAGEAQLFDSVAVVHPSGLTVADADKLLVPAGLYFSQGESATLFNDMATLIKSKPIGAKSDFKRYDTMAHGFAAARADLNNPANKEAFADVYSRLNNFFCNTF